MIKFNIQKWLLMFLFFISMSVYAAIPEWHIIPDESNITFTGTQNNAPVSGSFKKFIGEISFDSKQLNASKVHIMIDMNSVSTNYGDLTTALLTSDWFDVKEYPKAIFEANHFIKVGENKYEAKGTLTIRNKKAPVTISFLAQELSPTKVYVKGGTTLKRTLFGVGQGEWADTSAVKDEVQVNFVITATKK